MPVGFSKEEIKAILVKELNLLQSEGVTEIPVEPNMLLQTPPETSSEKISSPEKSKVTASKKVSKKKESVANFELPEGDKRTQWNYLRDVVLNCPVCQSHVKSGKKVVFGMGNLDADIFFCGEAPGADEEIQGEPFVGRAGQLLTKIIQAMGLQRDQVYIGNIMNWRPEMPTEFGNRPPTQDEMEVCLPYLKAQLRIVKPKVIMALGATAVNGLLGYDPNRRMGDVRGKWFEFEGIPLIITYHPSYLLRNQTPKAKRQVWEDFLEMMRRLQMPISEKQKNFFKS